MWHEVETELFLSIGVVGQYPGRRQPSSGEQQGHSAPAGNAHFQGPIKNEQYHEMSGGFSPPGPAGATLYNRPDASGLQHEPRERVSVSGLPEVFPN